MKMQIRGKGPDGTIIIFITTTSPEEVEKLVEYTDLDSVDIYSKPSSEDIRPLGYIFRRSVDPFYDELLKDYDV